MRNVLATPWKEKVFKNNLTAMLLGRKFLFRKYGTTKNFSQPFLHTTCLLKYLSVPSPNHDKSFASPHLLATGEQFVQDILQGEHPELMRKIWRP
jgi:hypothetical protein